MMNKSYDYKHPTSVWEIVKEDIERDIIGGKYATGDCVPSIAQIGEQYSVGSSTAKRVLKELERDGSVLNKRGIGYFVKPYVKEKLIAKHRKALEDKMLKLAVTARSAGYSKEEFERLVDEVRGAYI